MPRFIEEEADLDRPPCPGHRDEPQLLSEQQGKLCPNCLCRKLNAAGVESGMVDRRRGGGEAKAQRSLAQDHTADQ